MKLELHDNAREGLQFLTVGLLVLLVARGGLLAMDLWNGAAETDPLAAAVEPFRNGYPLLAEQTVVIGGSELIPRAGVAGIFTLMLGVIGALLLAPLGFMQRWSVPQTATMGARIGLLVGMGWSLYAVLRVPPHSTRIGPSGLTTIDHSSFLGEIPWPWSATERTVAWSTVRALEHGPVPDDASGPLEEVRVLTDQGSITVAREQVTLDHHDRSVRQEEAARLVAELKTRCSL